MGPVTLILELAPAVFFPPVLCVFIFILFFVLQEWCELGALQPVNSQLIPWLAFQNDVNLDLRHALHPKRQVLGPIQIRE